MIQSDKLLHAETSALIVVVLSLVMPFWEAAVVALGVGIGKELWDKHHGGVPTWGDLLADVIGIAFGCLVAWLSILVSIFV